jgi:hypothetical protein
MKGTPISKYSPYLKEVLGMKLLSSFSPYVYIHVDTHMCLSVLCNISELHAVLH